jgi:rsbT co-antagonist protein RsbR
LVAEQEGAIVRERMRSLQAAGALQSGRIKEAELQGQCRNFLELLRPALSQAGADVHAPQYQPVRRMLSEVAQSRAQSRLHAERNRDLRVLSETGAVRLAECRWHT